MNRFTDFRFTPTSRRALRAALLIPIVAVLGCSQPSQDVPPASTAPATTAPPPPTATLPDGAEITIELAITADELATGLMFRPSLADDRGMLLLFGEERFPSIWMKNTLISLDLVFLDNRGMVVHFEPRVPPCATDPCPTYSSEGEARAVLELAAGSIEAHGLAIGDQLQFGRVPGYPVVEDPEEPPVDAADAGEEN